MGGDFLFSIHTYHTHTPDIPYIYTVHTCIQHYIHTYIQFYMHRYRPEFGSCIIHTFIHTYTNVYIHASTHVHTQ